MEIDRQFFILPLAIVQECVELTRTGVGQSRGGDIANIRGEIVPSSASGVLRHKDEADIEQIVITEVKEEHIGLVWTTSQGSGAVIKTLSEPTRTCRGIGARRYWRRDRRTHHGHRAAAGNAYARAGFAMAG